MAISDPLVFPSVFIPPYLCSSALKILLLSRSSGSASAMQVSARTMSIKSRNDHADMFGARMAEM
jgi:hypothetical protein